MTGTKSKMRSIVLAAAAALPLIVVGATASAAPAAYNGTWRVQMVTDSGSCDRSYSYAVAIQNGAARYIPAAGDSPATISGGVGPDGSVALTLQRSIATANASGRLQGSTGAGTWKLAMLGCSGRWTASRRTQTASAD